jgi:hypothetical protein
MNHAAVAAAPPSPNPLKERSYYPIFADPLLHRDKPIVYEFSPSKQPDRVAGIFRSLCYLFPDP